MSVGIILTVTDIAKMESSKSCDHSTAKQDVGDGIETRDNEPNRSEDTLYAACGVAIAMVLVGVIIVLLAVTISKLRKREDHTNDQVSEQPVVQTATPVSAIVATTTNGQTVIATTQEIRSKGIVNPTITSDNNVFDNNTTFITENTEQFIWQFPPPYPPHTPPPQYSLYNEQDAIVHGLQSDRPGFAKGFRKNLGGRWRRLVKKKTEPETCAIPPELKDQLKTIYVY